MSYSVNSTPRNRRGFFKEKQIDKMTESAAFDGSQNEDEDVQMALSKPEQKTEDTGGFLKANPVFDLLKVEKGHSVKKQEEKRAEYVKIYRDMVISSNRHSPIGVLNMADHQRPGGYWVQGAICEEALLCDRTTLYYSIPGENWQAVNEGDEPNDRSLYPLRFNEVLFSENVRALGNMVNPPVLQQNCPSVFRLLEVAATLCRRTC